MTIAIAHEQAYLNRESAEQMKEAWERHEGSGSEFRADAKTAQLDLYGAIRNQTLKEVSNFLASVKGKDLTVRINSPGGDYYAGLSIANRLAEHDGKIHTIVDGLAASAAAVVFMAGDLREMRPNSQLMFHAVMTYAFGNRFDMEKIIAQLKASDEAMADFLLGEGKLNMKRGDFDAWMQREEFLSRDAARKLNADNMPEEEEKHEDMDPDDPDHDKENMEEEEEKKVEDIYRSATMENMIAERLGFKPGR